LVFGSFVLGAVICLLIMINVTGWPAFLSKHDLKKPGMALKARLPDDMRTTAQEAADDFKNRQFDEAASCYQRIIDKYPECLYAWSNLGVVRFQQGHMDEAKSALLNAVSLSPEDAFSWANLGIVYYQLKDYSDATDALEKAVGLSPDEARSHNYLGCCYSQTGDKTRATREFETAIKLNDGFGDAYFNLALNYATEKPPDLEKARSYYKKARDLGIARDPRLEKIMGNSDAEK